LAQAHTHTLLVPRTATAAMQMSKIMYLLALFGAVQLQGCGGGEEEVDPTPDPHEGHEHEDVVVTVSSELTFDGMTEEQAKAIEPAIVTGIAATIEGVSDDDVTITGYSRRLSGRQLTSHGGDSVKIAFEIVVPEGVEASAVSGGITEAAADATAVLEAITAAVEADADLKKAFADLGGDLTAVTLTVAEPVVTETDKDEVPATEKPTEAPTTKKPTEKPTEAPTTAEPVNGTNSSRRLEFAFTTNELIA